MQEQFEPQTTVIFGPTRSGKSALLNRLIGKPWSDEYVGTISAEQKIKEREGMPKLVFWDIGPGTTNRAIKIRIKHAQQIYLVFDLSNQDSLKELKQSLVEKEIKFPEQVQVILIGTHLDLVDGTEQLDSEASAFLKELPNGTKYHKVSSKNDTNILDLYTFTKMIPCIEKSVQLSAVSAEGRKTSRRLNEEFNIESTDFTERFVRANSDTDFVESITRYGDSSLNDNPEIIATGTKLSSPQKKRPEKDEETKISDRNASNLTPPPSIDYVSFGLKMAGMAIMLAGVIALIYVAASVVTTASLTAVVHQIIVTVGGLLGASASTLITGFGNICATLGMSTTTASHILGVGGSVALMGLGFTLFGCAKQRETELNLTSGLVL